MSTGVKIFCIAVGALFLGEWGCLFWDYAKDDTRGMIRVGFAAVCDMVTVWGVFLIHRKP